MLTLPPLQEFSEWLRGRPWDAVVGLRLECACCPLALWLAEHFGQGVLVDERSVWMGEAERCATPPDYVAVIEAIDYAGATPDRAVQVVEVQHVLQMILREQGEEVDDRETP